ncbi:hypothetical protein RclHR1_04580004 [Rhizophagus clarus]|uniref:F-box domain-containing protein n=1 Tax=Rhizophagus clarus TaxID=94130 RepID=A0A2Z6RIB8_9GLOM|nr:hypothetical protein RclHR1_04580004 [Rhizophagus clarus]
MTTALPNELLLKFFNYVLLDNNYNFLWRIRRTCRKWSILIPVVISDRINGRFGNDLKFELRMEFAHKSIYFHSKFETFENICTFRLFNSSSSSPSSSSSIAEEELMRNPGDTCCAIHLEMFVKQLPTSLPFGWRTKEYIPTILLPGENPCDIKQARFGMGMILGYKLSPCTNILAEDVFKFRVDDDNNNNNNAVNVVNISGVKERREGNNILSSNPNDDDTLHMSVGPSNGVELIYLNIPRKVMLELMDALDILAGLFSLFYMD